ncbi:MAG: site-2 protease family protein [Clostridia bacterium]|nr:site-2 protease family protein [Clostridia bacterium]
MFFGNNRKIFYIFIAVFVGITLINYMSNINALKGLLLSLPGVLIAITFHEYAHAFAAYKLGDETAKSQGRMTLNPLDHMDPLGMILLVFFGFGWGKPVQVNYRNLNRNISAKKAEAIIAFAGPFANFILAIIFACITTILVKFNVLANANYNAIEAIFGFLQSTVLVNIGLGVFNLIPLPPLDGSKVLSAFLPNKVDMWFKNNEYYAYILFIIIWITGIAGAIISPAISGIYSLIMKLVFKIFGI